MNTQTRAWSVYALVDPRTNEIRYVGVAGNTRTRLQSHLREAKKNKQTYKARWLRQILSQGMLPLLQVLEAGSGGGWAESEKRWIAELRAAGTRLSNLTDGGEGVPGLRWTPEQRESLAARVRAYRVAHPEEKARLDAASRAYWNTENARLQQSEKTKAYVSRPDTRARLRAAAEAQMTPTARAVLSAQAKEFHARHPGLRTEHSARMKAWIADPANRAKLEDGLSRHLADPQWRAEFAERSRKHLDAARSKLATLEVRAKIRASALRRWSNQAYKNEMQARARAAGRTPEERARRSARMRNRWADPEKRTALIAKLKAAKRRPKERIV